MHMRTTNLASLLVFCFALGLSPLLGCDSPKSSLGGLPGSTGSSSEGGESETSQVPAISVSGFDPATDVGAPCQLSGLPASALLELGNAECMTGLCLYPDTLEANAQQTCRESSECAGFGSGVICGPDGHCQLDPAHVAEASMCTAECNDDSDCVGADGTACEGGFACVPVTSLGSTCCLKFCACIDDYDSASAAGLAEACAAGTQPGCCDQDPPGEGCGG